MTDLDFDGLVEITAVALYRTEPEVDQPVDLDGRPTDPAFIVPWVTLCECYEPLAETVRQKARAILSAVLPHVLAVPREALEIVACKRQCRDNLMGNRDVAEAALAWIDKLTENTPPAEKDR